MKTPLHRTTSTARTAGYFLALLLGLMTGCGKPPGNQVPAAPPVASAPKAQAPQKEDRYALPPKIRGINTQTDRGNLRPEMARLFAEWGVNVVRVNFETDATAYGIPYEKGVQPSQADPLAPYRSNIALLKEFSRACKQYNIKIIVAADNIHGRKLDYFYKMGGDDFSKGLKAHLLEFWKGFATEFKDDTTIVAYDVLNEPNYAGRDPSKGTADAWTKDIFPAALAEIRSVNPDIWVITMPWPWGLAWGFVNMPHYDDPRVIYSFHIYSPHQYTHQGVRANADTRGKLTYPGMLKEYDTSPEVYWDANEYRKVVQPVIDFQKKYNARILIGEFGVVRWAPGREKYIADVIGIFDENGWDWLYHSFGEWSGWNPTFAPDEEPTQVPSMVYGGYQSDIFRFLLEQWAKNGTLNKVSSSQ